eukprot:6312931-Alexandrium_andersonii.AAC.1
MGPANARPRPQVLRDAPSQPGQLALRSRGHLAGAQALGQHARGHRVAAVGVCQGEEADALELPHGRSQPPREGGARLGCRGVEVAPEVTPSPEHLQLR